MAVSRVKTWIAEILFASDLNAEIDNILNNGEDLAWPATKAKDLDGNELILDSDADTSITADTDDQIDFRVGGTDVLVLTTTQATINGSKVMTQNDLQRQGITGAAAKIADVEYRVANIEHNSILEHQVFS